MNKGIDLDTETVDEQLVTETVGEFFTEGHFDISVDPDDPKVYADGEDISEAIRSSEVSSHVSKVSNIIPVRHVLIAAQRAYIAREAASDSFSEGAGVVAEGVTSPRSLRRMLKCVYCLPLVRKSAKPVEQGSRLLELARKTLRHETRLIPRSRISRPQRKVC